MSSGENNKNTGNIKPNIVSRNEPKLSEHDVDRDLNEMRTSFIPHIKDFIERHYLFKDEEEVGIEFAHKGVGSIIAIIDTPTNKLVLKIPRSKDSSAAEWQFLKVWEESGVVVPRVIETGMINDSPYMLMQFIDAPTLDVCYSYEELIVSCVFVEMGKVLRLMHSKPVAGYGYVIDGKPEFKTIEEWLVGNDMKNRFDYIKKYDVLEGLEDVLAKAIDVIIEHSKSSSSAYCHDDFGQSNIFATDPITIFDPNPRFNSGYYDLGKIKFFNIAFKGSKSALDQVIKGYFGNEVCNDRVLDAYTLIAFIYKCPYWKKTGREKELERVKEYFRQNQI